jgi:hypothetical protein
MVADESADCGQGIDLPDQFKGFSEFSFGHQSHIALCILLNRAGFLARRKRDPFFRRSFLRFPTIENPSKALLFLSIFRNELSRTTPETDVTGVTSFGLDHRSIGSSFNHGPAFLILFPFEGP